MDAVVVAAPQSEPAVQMACVEARVPCVDVSPSGVLYDLAVRDCAGTTVPLVMMCGFFPGLSGVLAAHAALGLDEVHRIDIGLLQSCNARVGSAGVTDMLRAIARPVDVGGRFVRGFGATREFVVGRRIFVGRAMQYEEAAILSASLGVDHVTYWTAWDSAGLTRAIAMLAKLALIRPILRAGRGITPRHDPRRPETTWLAAEAVGTVAGRPASRRIGAEASSDYGTTAAMAAVVVERLLAGLETQPGILVPKDFLDLEGVEAAFGDRLRVYR
ncbi:hypothetical protein IU448_16785 [Nocardia flavorosea]|uniref:hypothetical protein n=1 Tax=Nocardia flavorosea TaxID=53429 RepID=UPI0018954A04|nr:hypothetical protein [Nocardia flavorosea]MBF6350660.1 hypothetical protein [Nocardia flavorosea]